MANNANLTVADSSSFKYKSTLLGKPTNIIINNVEALDGNNPIWKNAQIIVPLKYISPFFRSLEMPLINTKLYIQLNFTNHSVISTVDAAESTTFKITKTKLYVPVVTLNTEDNNKLNQLLESELGDSRTNPKSKDNKFKRIVYWNQYKSKIDDVIQPHNNNNFKRTLLDTAIPGVNKLFVMGFNDNAENPAGNPPVIKIILIELKAIVTENIFYRELILKITMF